uniref:FAR1 domain-containing protein n=1 Tax=Lactuca sativa TaxID=4236 RepID=A0A9R1X3Z6_LACSA|nr:hypothetical protein LSAT_V11C600325820 [Lactuca sativa]
MGISANNQFMINHLQVRILIIEITFMTNHLQLIHKKTFKILLFDSLDIGLDFYKTYGQESGFDVHMSSQKRYNDGKIRLRYSTCSSSGFTESFKNENINVKFSDVKRKRTSSKKNG